MVPLEVGQEARDRLTGLGYALEWKTYPTGHAVHPDEVRDIGAFLSRVLIR